MQSVAPEQQKVIKGKVFDNTNSEIPGANVLIKGTQRGAITDLDGNFSISVERRPTRSSRRFVYRFCYPGGKSEPQ